MIKLKAQVNSKHHGSKHHGKSRSVLYCFVDNAEHTRNLLNCEEVLAKAKSEGYIVNYDDGRDRDPWFEAYPGKQTRALRDRFLKAGYQTQRSHS